MKQMVVTTLIFLVLVLSAPVVEARHRTCVRCYPSRDKARAALRIAGPAAIGAGIGAIVKGGKGAAIGGLLGAGAGIIYELSNRDGGRKYCFRVKCRRGRR